MTIIDALCTDLSSINITQRNCREISQLTKSIKYLTENKKNLIFESTGHQYRIKVRYNFKIMGKVVGILFGLCGLNCLENT